MYNLQNYPISLKTDEYMYMNNKESFPRFTSNDSGISFGIESDNESIFSDECEYDIEQKSITITNDGKDKR